MKPIAQWRFALAGPGKVGESLARWTVAAGASCLRIGARQPARAAALAAEVGAAAVPLAELATEECDLLLLCVADAALVEVAADLARRPQAPVILHVSGSLAADALAPLAAAGRATGSCHPLVAFAAVRPAPPRPFAVGFDGAPAAGAAARRLAEAWGAEAIPVPAAERAVYHLAATLAAGGVIATLAAAAELGRRAGLEAAFERGLLALARSALDEAARATAGNPAGLAAGVTGAWARGDLPTVQRHLAAVARRAPERLGLLLALGEETLRQRRERGLEDEAQGRLAAALASGELLP